MSKAQLHVGVEYGFGKPWIDKLFRDLDLDQCGSIILICKPLLKISVIV
jgi:hypothetical protein